MKPFVNLNNNTYNQLLVNTLNNLLSPKHEIEDIIDMHQSHTTHSIYILVNTVDNYIYQLAFSDHESKSHPSSIQFLDKDNLVNSLELLLEPFLDFYDYDWVSNYDISLAKPYEPKKIVKLENKLNSDKAKVSNNFVMKKVELLYNNQILKVTYDGGQSELYVNYLPPYEISKEAILNNFYYRNNIDKNDYADYDIYDLNEDEDEEYLNDCFETLAIEELKKESFECIDNRYFIFDF